MTHHWQIQDVVPILSFDTAGSFLLLGCNNGSIYYIGKQKRYYISERNSQYIFEKWSIYILEVRYESVRIIYILSKVFESLKKYLTDLNQSIKHKPIKNKNVDF